MEVREPGFQCARALEASGFICYDEIITRGNGGVFLACGFV